MSEAMVVVEGATDRSVFEAYVECFLARMPREKELSF